MAAAPVPAGGRAAPLDAGGPMAVDSAGQLTGGEVVPTASEGFAENRIPSHLQPELRELMSALVASVDEQLRNVAALIGPIPPCHVYVTVVGNAKGRLHVVELTGAPSAEWDRQLRLALKQAFRDTAAPEHLQDVLNGSPVTMPLTFL